MTSGTKGAIGFFADRKLQGSFGGEGSIKTLSGNSPDWDRGSRDNIRTCSNEKGSQKKLMRNGPLQQKKKKKTDLRPGKNVRLVCVVPALKMPTSLP